MLSMYSPRKNLIDLCMSVAHHHEVYLHYADHTRRHQQARIPDKKIVLVLGDAVVDLGRFYAVGRNKLRSSGEYMSFVVFHNY